MWDFFCWCSWNCDSAFVLTLVEAGKSICTWYIVTFIYIGHTQWWILPKPLRRTKSFGKTMSNLVNIVSFHNRLRLLCLPILLVLLFLRSPAMTWSRVTHQRTEKAFSSCSPMNRIKFFPWHKKRCALLGLDRPETEFRSASLGGPANR